MDIQENCPHSKDIKYFRTKTEQHDTVNMSSEVVLSITITIYR